ncbi:hypothetical protein TRFO_25568 [Tritrichomonas foetus]|uniref:Uncharacterized protein n=1 Tax=Tritrichomonas foetus TaxID=1144522 RepID=A0A1J4K629_9EUKA|nr:hypothetical protein TRFO_25568 [Tritrichomonas foetus]|eukprot:OHT06450.1 hypothetical protein TRFO_25568 [Tritrichomonas foetus]
MTAPELPDDILSKFLAETKAAEKKKEKPKPVELPDNFVVYDPKAEARKRVQEAKAMLNRITERPDLKKTNVGSVIASRMRNPAPSTAFIAPPKKKQDKDIEPENESENESEKEDSF